GFAKLKIHCENWEEASRRVTVRAGALFEIMTEIPYPAPDTGLLRPSLRAPDRRVLQGALLLLVVGILTLAPVGYVILSSFDVAPIGAPFQFGLGGWRDALSSRNSWSSILYSFLLSVRVPIAIAFAFV